MAGLTLYGSQGSRSPLVNWGANEFGVELTMGDLSKNPHPFGQIPCLEDDDDVLVFESGAILQYLYSKSAETNGDSASRKASISSWISCTSFVAKGTIILSPRDRYVSMNEFVFFRNLVFRR